MADFRRVALQAVKWFPQSRKNVPVTPVRVQVPASPCSITLLPGRYSIDLTVAGSAVHDAFVEFVGEVEAHALEHAKPSSSGLRWYSCFSAYSLTPTMRLSAFDDAKFFEEDGTPSTGLPTHFKACSCILELQGAWTTDTVWGLRWKVLEVKRTPQAPPALSTMFLDDDEDAPPGPPQLPMFIDE